MTRRFIGVVTVARSDYSLYLPVLKRMREHAELDFGLFVSGAHLDPGFGATVTAIEADGYRIIDRIDILLASDSTTGTAKSIGLGVMGFADAYRRRRPDILLVLGDRFEMLSAVVAAAPYRIPVGHIHGGEVSEGAVDDLYRHCITKMSHLHFVSTELAARRVLAMGEDPGHVFVTGAPGIDNVLGAQKLSRDELADRYGIPRSGDFLVVTYHPVTMEPGVAREQVAVLMQALDSVKVPSVFTLANADPEGRLINREIATHVARRPDFRMVENFGADGYASVMSHALAMVGNSSSGIIEAASFELPVVNVGSRQAGRERSANVIDADCSVRSITDALRRATSRKFRDGLKGISNIYGDGNAAARIVKALREVSLDDTLLRKRFFLNDPD